MSNESEKRLSKNERREQAREKARLAREAQVKKEKRNRLFLQGGIAVAVVGIIAVIGLVIAQAVQPAGPGPENMASGGAVFEGENFSVQPTPAVEDGAELVAAPTDRTQAPLDVVIYVDYMCVHCGAFEQQAGPMLEQWVGSGQATVQVYPVNFLDGSSAGTRYSTRAANAFSCVVDQQPDAAWSFHRLLLSAEIQPEMGTQGLTNAELLDVAEQAGADANASLKRCIDETQFAGFINDTTKQAGDGVIGLAEGAQLSDGQGGMQNADAPQRITGTPTILVNGLQAPSGVQELEQFMLMKFSEVTGENGADEGVEDDAETPDEAASEDEEAATEE